MYTSSTAQSSDMDASAVCGRGLCLDKSAHTYVGGKLPESQAATETQ